MIAELLNWLLVSSLMLGALIATVLLLRRPVARYLGAKVAYALWALPLVVLAAPLLGPYLPTNDALLPVMSNWVAMPTLVVAPQATPSVTSVYHGDWVSKALLAVWLAGASLALGRLLLDAVRSQRFLREVLSDGEAINANSWVSKRVPYPLAVGVLRPRVLLPQGLNAALSERQCRLVLAHEQCHARRRDNFAILAARLLGCVFWFHPLVLLAWRFFRVDQELACDAHVLAGADAATRRDYGHALLAVAAGEAAGRDPLLQLHAGWNHPLRERIMMIRHHQRSRSKNLLGGALLTAMVAFAGTLAIAANHETPVPPAPSTPMSERTDTPPAPPRPAIAPAPKSMLDVTVAPNPPAVATPAPPPKPAAAPQPIKRVAPKYPRQAAVDGVEGEVQAEFTVRPDGSVADITVLGSQPEGVFDDQAIDALSQWQFEPVLVEGKLVEVRAVQTIAFRLDS